MALVYAFEATGSVGAACRISDTKAAAIFEKKTGYVPALRTNRPDLFDGVRVYLDSER